MWSVRQMLKQKLQQIITEQLFYNNVLTKLLTCNIKASYGFLIKKVL